MASILVIGETDDAGLTAPSLEMLGAASRLSGDLGGGVALALIGSGLADAAAAAGAAGADTVYTAEAESLATYQTESYLPVAQAIVEQDSPSVVLLSQSSIGRDLAPRLATRLGTAAIMDSLALEVEGDRVKATRSCYGGNARQVVTVQTDPQVITVRPKSQDPLEADASRSAQVIAVEVAEPTLRARTTGKEQAESEGIRLEDAEVVVSGGRGPGRSGGLRRPREPRRRAHRRCRFLTRRLRPRLVPALAAGRSHRHGRLAHALRGDRHLWSQPAHGRLRRLEEHRRDQQDPDAPIFSFSRFGIVDDYKKVLPALEAAFADALD